MSNEYKTGDRVVILDVSGVVGRDRAYIGKVGKVTGIASTCGNGSHSIYRVLMEDGHETLFFAFKLAPAANERITPPDVFHFKMPSNSTGNPSLLFTATKQHNGDYVVSWDGGDIRYSHTDTTHFYNTYWVIQKEPTLDERIAESQAALVEAIRENSKCQSADAAAGEAYRLASLDFRNSGLRLDNAHKEHRKLLALKAKS